MGDMMRALRGGLGSDWEMHDLPVPGPGAGQILVRVRAAGLNRADLYMLEGSYNPNSKTSEVYTAGLEMAGEVAGVGDGVVGFDVGDRVMGGSLGAFADYAVLDHRHVYHVPETLGFAEAAALPVALATEYDALAQAGFRAGDRVLVLGATSSIGLVGVQLAKALGATFVAATTMSSAKESSLSAVGADLVINTRTQNLSDLVLGATGDEGVDVVLDHLGGQAVAECLAATRVGGTIVNIGRLAGAASTLDLNQLSFRRLRLQGTTFSVRTPAEKGDVYTGVVARALPLVAAGRVRPVIDEVVPFQDAKRAAGRLRANTPVGKLVLDLT